jgi:F-type H+-transporting ATPase subunit delta
MIEAEYSKALFELASDNAKEILDELDVLIKAMDENPDVYQVLEAPTISDTKKKDIIKNISKDMSDVLVRFLYVLIDNKRFNKIKGIREEYSLLVNNSIKVIDVLVTSKVALNKEQKIKLESLLASKLSKKVNIINVVDESLIGGIKCEYEGKLVDLTVRGKLNQIKSLL